MGTHHSNNTLGLVDAFLNENKEYLDESKNEEMDSEMPDEYDDEEEDEKFNNDESSLSSVKSNNIK